ncbi:MAG: cation-translocating P-type ATPase [Defluviitaleaceae bacterium]|nr:cation-translocating P-type ATPase [Defluviitaleaceae bacterium]
MFTQTKEDALRELGADVAGLSGAEAASRLEKYGENRLHSAKKKSLFLRILAQFKDFLVIILLAAAVISVIAGDGEGFERWKDSALIFGILLVNVIISITQENRADNALRKLKNMSAPKAKVRRDDEIIKIESCEVVPGDIVVLDAGDFVPADLRIIESVNLKIDEAALTGESLPVSKDADAVFAPNAPVGDRKNSAFTGTVVTYGRGRGVVCGTGMNTEMGKIAAFLNETPDQSTPLQEKLNAMAKILGIICIVICAAIFAIGFLRGTDFFEMLMVSVSLAVAAVPEGIAIVATVILAIGVQKMVRSNVIVKRLRAVETLGSTTVICSDKTGTLTQNKMTVVETFSDDSARMTEIAVLCNDAVFNTVDKSHEATHSLEAARAKRGMDAGDISHESTHSLEAGNKVGSEIAHSLEAGSKVGSETTHFPSRSIGDPTEIAMLAFAAKNGIFKDALCEKFPRIGEIPFDSERKMMSTLNAVNDADSARKSNRDESAASRLVMHTKGAPDAIISRSSRMLQNGEVVAMTEDLRRTLIEQNEKFAADALRVLAFAYRECTDADDCAEENLIFAGMMCMIDPPRVEVADAVARCHTAGISVKMITGDHKITAGAIAKSLGITTTDALSGVELDELSDDELREKVRHVNVFARVSPEHKVRIVSAIKANGDIAAMTGDGVNDAPSLKKADIGIAMGITGTDVSKEAADMILTDDNFTSIVKAVEQGRTIYGNIRKVTGYLLSCNIGEILILFIAILVGLPVPLVATQLLFVNLLTDAFPAFALGMEGKEPGVMNRQPRPPKEPIINKTMRGSLALRAILLCIGSLGAFLYGFFMYAEAAIAISMCFFTLVAAELLLSFVSKAETFSGVTLRAFKGLFSNKFLNISIGLSMLILVAVMYVPFLNDLFSTVPLSPTQLFVCIGFMLVPILGGEVSKKIFK